MEVIEEDAAARSTERDAEEPLLVAARRLLATTGYWPLREVRCECSQGAVVLSGTVPTYYQKQLAQAVLMASPLIETVVNRIEVAHSPQVSTGFLIAPYVRAAYNHPPSTSRRVARSSWA